MWHKWFIVYMEWMDAANAIKRARASCSERNVRKRAGMLQKAGQKRSAKQVKVKQCQRKKPYRLCVLWLEVPGRFESSIESTNHASVVSHVSASCESGFCVYITRCGLFNLNLFEIVQSNISQPIFGVRSWDFVTRNMIICPRMCQKHRSRLLEIQNLWIGIDHEQI